MLAKLSKNGDLIWVKTYGGTSDDQFLGIAAMPNNDIIAVGSSFSGDGTFAHANLGQAGVVVRINPDGKVVWSRTLIADQSAVFYGVAITSDNGIIAVGNIDKAKGDFASWYGDLSAFGTDAYPDMVIAHLDSLGVYTGAKIYASSADTNVLYGVATDASGNVVAVGQAQGPGGNLPATCGMHDAIIIKNPPDYPLN